MGQTTVYTYDGNGNRLTQTDVTDTQTYTYNAFGQVLTATDQMGGVTTYTYDAHGHPLTVKDALNHTTTLTVNAQGLVTSVTDALGHALTLAYTAQGLLTSRTDAAGQTTNYEYDAFHRLVKTTYPAATTGATRLFESVTYDLAGQVKTRTDTAGRTTTFDYDTAQRLNKTTDAANQITLYGYNGRSQLVSVTDAANQLYTFAYDPLGRVLSQTRAGTTQSYAYDAVGRRTQRTAYGGAVTNYSYDALNRLTTISYPDTTTATYSYDALSRLATATNANGTVTMAYDNRSRVQSVTDVFGQVISYGYDANSNRTALQLGATTNATYAYDTANRLTTLTDNTNAAFTFGYDVTNKLTTRTLPNGVGVNYAYDGLSRLTNMGYVAGTNTLASYGYGYNTASQITGITEPTTTKNYTYDSVDRLTGATDTSNPTLESYAYNGVGNRTASHLSATYAYQPFNRLTATASTTYTYNPNGNLTAKTDATGTWTYAWDYENRLTQVTKPDGVTVQYKYDALGRRIQRTPSAGLSTNFTYDGADVILDTNSDSSTVNYVNGPGIDNKLKLTHSASGARYFVSDHLGSTRALTDTSANITESVSYDAFGNATGTLSTRYGYTGRELDADTGLMYYRARWYDPQAGRFISEDPIGFRGGNNWYAYVSNSPLMAKDPSGLEREDAVIRQYMKGLDPYCRAVCSQSLNCPFSDQAPTDPGFSMSNNIREAEDHWIIYGPSSNPKWFYNQVNDNGPWDYKRGDESKQDFGNAHFGIMCLAIGFSETNCQREAGRNQYGKKLAGIVDPSQSAGYPGGDYRLTRFIGRVADYIGVGRYLYGQYPFGDDLRDAGAIKKGFDYYHATKARQKCECDQ